MNEINKFGASAPMAGYLFQCRLALLRGLQLLKRHPNSLISIEKYDDVSFENGDHGKCLMQAKHHVAPKSLSDMSVDLWKTLRVWLETFEESSLTAGTSRRMLITTATADAGSAMSFLRPEHNSVARNEAHKLLRKAASESKNTATKEGRAAYLKLSDSEAELFLQSVEVYDNHPNLIDMMDEIEGELVLLSPEHKSLIAEYLEGWWLNVVAQHLIDNDAADIPVQNIIRKANEIGNQFKENGLPVDDPVAIGAKEYSESDEDALFVRQMRVIDLADNIIRRAVRDYYRSSAQRSKWARESLLLDGETESYDEKLQDRWARKFDADCAECGDFSDGEKKKLGRAICTWATQEQIGFRNVVESWITAGSFHSLADRMHIGWHPEYTKLLEGENA